MKATDRLLLTVLLLAAAPAAIAATTQQDDVQLLLRAGGTITLPAGMIELSRPLEVPPGAVNLTLRGAPGGTTLRATPQFRGPALLVARQTRGLRLEQLAFDGRRAQLETPRPALPDDTAFADFFPASGIWLENATDAALTRLEFHDILSFPVLVTRGQTILIEDVQVRDSGGRNAKGRNNTTGGILFEEGVAQFTVRRCTFTRVRGNAVWTHSWHRSPLSRAGLIAQNRFAEIGRDAIQIGHAANVTVEQNEMTRIGFPVEIVDLENQGIPVGVDTAGNVSQTVYRRNSITEVNGKCFDLDGFHHSEVLDNVCINRGPAAEYPTGHFGVVFNNTNPGMTSEHVTVRGNEISGMRLGGIFVIGTNHKILQNRLTNLNTAHCNDTKLIQCIYVAAEPDMLRSGIYLGLKAERAAPARGIEVRGNILNGYGVKDHCVVLAPGLRREDDVIAENSCSSAAAR